MQTLNRLSPIFAQLKPSSTLYINETVNRLWKEGKQVFHMGFGESRFDVHPKLQQALADNAHKKSYLAARGLPELCDAVASYYSDKLNLDVNSSQVIIGPGSKALIYGIQMAMDADIFLPTPSWVSYGPQAELLNRNFSYIPANAEDGYQFDISAFDKLVKESKNPNKLLVINSPNNPTGKMFSADFLKELADYCRENNILVLSDEIYFMVSHGDVEHTSIAKYYPEGTFILGGLSKHLSIGGWRMGIGILPDNEMGQQIMKALVVIASEIWSSVAAPIQYAALTAYSGDADIEKYVDNCTQIHGIRTRFIYRKLTELGILCTQPKGAFYVTANFDKWSTQLSEKGINTSDDLARYLLDNHSIATLSADSFGVPEKNLSLRLASSYLDFETEKDSERIYGLYTSGISEDEFMNTENHPSANGAVKAFADFVDSIGE